MALCRHIDHTLTSAAVLCSSRGVTWTNNRKKREFNNTEQCFTSSNLSIPDEQTQGKQEGVV